MSSSGGLSFATLIVCPFGVGGEMGAGVAAAVPAPTTSAAGTIAGGASTGGCMPSTISFVSSTCVS